MHSLRTKILTVILVFLAFLGAAFVLYSLMTTANYKQMRIEIIEGIVAFETEKVNKITEEIEHGAVSLARDGLMFYQYRLPELSEASALEYIRGFPVVGGAGFWFEPYAYDSGIYRMGIYVYIDAQTGEVHLEDLTDYDYHSRDWYRELSSGINAPYQVVWTKPYMPIFGLINLMTTAGAGIFDKDANLIGVSTVDWEIDEIIEELSAIKLTDNSHVLLCAPGQDLIISTTHKSIDVSDSITTLPWDVYASSISLDGARYMQFNRYMNNGWLLAVQIPENEIFADVENRNRRFSILIALGSILMLCLAYVFISRQINAPIQRLINDVSQLDLGNLDIRVEDSSGDELGLLGRAFNKMVADLKASINAYTREHAEKEQINADLRVAADIQVKMLPNIFPPFPDVEEFNIYASMLPAKEVGGDFYDFYLVDDDTLALVIADVSGKGVPAALFMVITKTLIKNVTLSLDNYSNGKTPKQVFEAVNNMLCESNDTQMFAEAFLGYYNLSTGKFTYVNAGHNPPVVKKGDGNYELVETKSGLFLGFMKNASYEEEEITLEPGDAVYLYTDGVTEALNGEDELFSESRMLEALAKHRDCRPKDLLPAIKQEINLFTGGAAQSDDITMLSLEINKRAGLWRQSASKELVVAARIESLYEVMAFVNTELTEYKYPQDLVDDIDTAVEEIFVNIANYAYEAAGGNVDISISAGEEVVIKFEDSGKPYNPLEQDDPDFDKPLMERDIGGLGIFLTKKFMDNLEYTRVGNKNVFVMSKKK